VHSTRQTRLRCRYLIASFISSGPKLPLDLKFCKGEVSLHEPSVARGCEAGCKSPTKCATNAACGFVLGATVSRCEHLTPRTIQFRTKWSSAPTSPRGREYNRRRRSYGYPYSRRHLRGLSEAPGSLRKPLHFFGFCSFHTHSLLTHGVTHGTSAKDMDGVLRGPTRERRLLLQAASRAAWCFVC
jgi:hypothetical protein